MLDASSRPSFLLLDASTDSLQEQVELFAIVVQEIEHQQRLSPAITTILSKAKLALSQLEKLLEKRFLNSVKSSSRVR